MAGWRARLALGAGALLLVFLAGLLLDRGLHRSLEGKARALDLSSVIEQTGLAGRVDLPRWSASRLRWLPRPRLVLAGVEMRIRSGLPGPGESAGRVRLEAVALVPAWDFLWTGRFDRVEIEGGLVQIGRDLLPEPPRDYVDPVDGTRRNVPWSAFLDLAQVSPSFQWEAGLDQSGGASVAREGEPSVISARSLELSFIGYELIPDRTLTLDRAQLRIRGDRVDLRGMLRVTDRQGRSIVLPFALQQRGAPSGSTGWEMRFGPRGSGLRVGIRSNPTDAESAWTVDLEDPEGHVAGDFLRGRAGVLRRLRWAGPWRLHVEGGGPFPSGIRRAQLELLSGRFQLEGDSLLAAVARGRLDLVPGRVDLQDFTLRSPYAGGDSATLQLSWLQTPEGRSLSGRLQGRIDPGWLALLGEGWNASGRLNCDLTFTGRISDDARGWSLQPRGTCRGELRRLGGPWFADTLRQGRIEAWAHARGIGFVLAGVWGGSPFRLETRDLPLPGPGYLELIAAGGRWDLRSAECRLEDFRLSPERFPRVASAPFWLGLPGRGSIRIETGSLGSVSFEHLRASVYRSRGSGRIDSLEADVAGGRIRNDPGKESIPGLGGARAAYDTRLAAEAIDLAQLQVLLRTAGLSLPGRPRGRLSGSFRIRWPRTGEGMENTQLDAALVVTDGSLSGLPAQEAFARQSGLSSLRELSFREMRFELRRLPGTLFWNRLRIEAPPLQVEGAGRLTAANWLEAAFSLRLSGDGGGEEIGGLLRGLLGEQRTTLYLGLRGAVARPEVSVLSRGEFLRELDAVRGSLLLGSPPGSSAR